MQLLRPAWLPYTSPPEEGRIGMATRGSSHLANIVRLMRLVTTDNSWPSKHQEINRQNSTKMNQFQMLASITQTTITTNHQFRKTVDITSSTINIINHHQTINLPHIFNHQFRKTNQHQPSTVEPSITAD